MEFLPLMKYTKEQIKSNLTSDYAVLTIESTIIFNFNYYLIISLYRNQSKISGKISVDKLYIVINTTREDQPVLSPIGTKKGDAQKKRRKI